MTSTSYNMGLNSDNRNSSRVLKPPGGGSSDIFGVTGQEALEPRRGKQHQTSSLFLGNGEENNLVKQSNKPGNDSYQRLFGDENTEPPVTPSNKNRMKSDILMQDYADPDAYADNVNVTHCLDNNGNQSTAEILEIKENYLLSSEQGNSPREDNGKGVYKARNPVTGFGIGDTPVRQTNYGRRRDGNPVTGEGYDAPSKPQTPQTQNGTSTPSSPNSTGNQASARQRVPPGGFSSGLW